MTDRCQCATTGTASLSLGRFQSLKHLLQFVLADKALGGSPGADFKSRKKLRPKKSILRTQALQMKVQIPGKQSISGSCRIFNSPDFEGRHLQKNILRGKMQNSAPGPLPSTITRL